MAEFFMPAFTHFQNENPWSASAGRLHYRITPTVSRDEEGAPALEGGTLTVEVWEGPWAYELSTVEETKVFPLTEEGMAAIPVWLEAWRQTMEARPQRTLEENIARRVEPETPEEKKE